jgi:hypothetical protein
MQERPINETRRLLVLRAEMLRLIEQSRHRPRESSHG